MKVIELYAENVKRIEAVLIKPEGNLVQITGENENGKTSVLDTLWWAFGGQNEIQSVPIRIGEKKARIDVDLGELKVTRFFNLQEDGSFTTRLEIRNAEGFKASSPQALLDKAVGRLTMDPLAFMKAKPADQAKQLRSLVPGFDFAKNDEAFKRSYELRTETGRQVRLLEGQLVSFNDLPPAVEDWQDPITVLNKVTDAAESNRKLAEEQRRRDDQRAEFTRQAQKVEGLVAAQIAMERRHKSELEQLQAKQAAEKAELEKQSTEACNDCDRLEKEVKEAKPLPEPLDLAVFEAELAEVQRKNKTAERAKSRDKLQVELKTMQESYDGLTKDLEKRKDLELAAMKEAQLPVEGLAFSDAGVTIKGHPLDQASASQQLRLSVAVAIAMNPKLRVMRIVDGSLLGRAQMAELEKIANEQDYQIWIERVATGEDVGIVIEAGRVKGQVIERPVDDKVNEAIEKAAAQDAAKKSSDDQSKPFTLL